MALSGRKQYTAGAMVPVAGSWPCKGINCIEGWFFFYLLLDMVERVCLKIGFFLKGIKK